MESRILAWLDLEECRGGWVNNTLVEVKKAVKKIENGISAGADEVWW